MGGTKTTLEYEINASKRMLYPYISTASGLAQWFADDASIDEDKNFHFVWDGEDHVAKMAAHRTNSFYKKPSCFSSLSRWQRCLSSGLDRA